MREPIREPTPQEQPTGRAAQPIRYVGPAPVGEVSPFRVGSLVHWGPTWGGMFVALGILLLLSSLGVAIGVGTSSTAVAIWEAISLIVSFFIGGWFAGRTLNLIDPLVSAAHGLLVWAVAFVFTIAFFLLAAVSGISALANVARVAIIGDLINLVGGAPAAAPAAPTAAQAAVTSSWIAFIILLLSVAAAIIGALVGNHSQMPTDHEVVGR